MTTRWAWAAVPVVAGGLIAWWAGRFGLPVVYVAAIVLATFVAWVLIRTRAALAVLLVAAVVAIALPATLAGGAGTDRLPGRQVPSGLDVADRALVTDNAETVGHDLVVVADRMVHVIDGRQLHTTATIATSSDEPPRVAANKDLFVHQTIKGRDVVSRYTLTGHRQWSVPTNLGLVMAATDDVAVLGECGTHTCRWTAVAADGHRPWTRQGNGVRLSLDAGVRGRRLPEQLVVNPNTFSGTTRRMHIYDVDTGHQLATTPSGTPISIGGYVIVLRSEADLEGGSSFAASDGPSMIGYKRGRQIWKSSSLTDLNGSNALVVGGRLLLKDVESSLDLEDRPLVRVHLKDGSLHPVKISASDWPDNGMTVTASTGNAVVTRQWPDDSEPGSQPVLAVPAGPGHAWKHVFSADDTVDVQPGGIVVIGPVHSSDPFFSQSERARRLRLRIFDPKTGAPEIDTTVPNVPFGVLVPTPGRALIVGSSVTELHY